MTRKQIEPKTGPWKLADIDDVPKHGHSVFTCFHGVGAMMGYELAGYNVLGGAETDKQMMRVLKHNHPGHSFRVNARELASLDVPKEMYGIGILDGFLPFSMSKRSRFLDEPFFHFVAVAKKWQPKVVVAETDKEIVRGRARGYVKKILEQLDEAGYDMQVFTLNACRMGCPQRRETVYLIGRHKALRLPKLKLDFREPLISVKAAWSDLPGQNDSPLLKRPEGKKIAWDGPAVVVTTAGKMLHPKVCRRVLDMEVVRLQTFPDDYNFCQSDVQYVCANSVPPYMMQRVAIELFWQWFGERL